MKQETTITMNKILVAYATWAGATHEVANEIAKELKSNNPALEVEVMPAKEVDSIKDYQAVILGSSIHASQPINTFNKFLRKFHKELTEIPVAVFVVCANMWEDTPKTRKETTQWINKALEKFPDIKPVALGLFAGAVITEGDDFKNLNFMFRKTILSMRDNLIKQYGKTDFRDWDAIRAWTDETYEVFHKSA